MGAFLPVQAYKAWRPNEPSYFGGFALFVKARLVRSYPRDDSIPCVENTPNSPGERQLVFPAERQIVDHFFSQRCQPPGGLPYKKDRGARRTF